MNDLNRLQSKFYGNLLNEQKTWTYYNLCHVIVMYAINSVLSMTLHRVNMEIITYS